jgi:hypothetical protein
MKFLMRTLTRNTGPTMGRLLLLLIGLQFIACGPAQPPAPHVMSATLLVAVDGLHWQQVLPAMRAGHAPNLLDLARRGSAVRLSAGSFPSAEAMWEAMATSRLASTPEAPTLWQILEDAGHPLGRVGWPDTPSRPAILVWSEAEEIIAGQHPRFMAVRHQPLAGTGTTDGQASALTLTDEGIGRLRALMPQNTDVIVVSGDMLIAAGPSFRAPKPQFRPPSDPGMLPLVSAGEGAGILDVLPSLLHLRHLQSPPEIEGAVMDELLVEGSR